jgi:hypothetical protein
MKFEFTSPEEMRKQLHDLKIHIDNSTSNKEELVKYYQELKKCIKRCERSNDDVRAIVFHTEMITAFHRLKELLDKRFLSYSTKSLDTPSSDKIKCFIEFASTFDDESYWKELAIAYTLQDYKKLSMELVKNLFSAKREARENLMNEEEQKFLLSLPNTTTIYRGGAEEEAKKNTYGISWSLDKAVAEGFAYKKQITTKKEMRIHEKTIPKSEVIAVFLERNEQEIIWFK